MRAGVEANEMKGTICVIIPFVVCYISDFLSI